MDDELIGWCVLATRAACLRMTAGHLKSLQDSAGLARHLPARFAWDRKATAHAQIFNLLADVITDRPVPAALLTEAVGAVHHLMVTVGPGADGRHEIIDREDLRVHNWRVGQLTRLGFPRSLAEATADQVDWHQIAALVHRGCPPWLALRIVS